MQDERNLVHECKKYMTEFADAALFCDSPSDLKFVCYRVAFKFVQTSHAIDFNRTVSCFDV